MATRSRNHGLRKLCGCARSAWAKCAHPWHFNYKPRGGKAWRFSLDVEVGKHLEGKTEAQTEAARIRAEIDAGTFRRRADDRPVRDTLTVRQLLDSHRTLFGAHHWSKTTIAQMPSVHACICRVDVELADGTRRPFGDWRIDDVTTGALRRFEAARLPAGRTTTTRNLETLRAAFNWAIEDGIIDTTPFQRAGKAVIKMTKQPPRSRRLEPGEAERLLAGCGEQLRPLVEAALETGCRKGELLSLQWHQVRFEPKAEIVLQADKTKTRTERRVPISTRLRAILDMRRNGPDGEPHPPEAYVFGTATGERVTTCKRAWQAAVLRAHDIRPVYVKGTAKLTQEAREQFRAINLHFHDLRREAGSRWLDGGVPIHVVRDWLGHTNVAQTSTYLASTSAGAHEWMTRFEEKTALQRIATEGRKRHHERPRTAERRKKTPVNTAIGVQ